MSNLKYFDNINKAILKAEDKLGKDAIDSYLGGYLKQMKKRHKMERKHELNMSKNISGLYYTPPTKEQFDELKQKAIDIWITGAIDAMDTCDKIFESKKYHHALFFLHLALEKVIKAFYIFKIDQAPPYIHDLKQLVKMMKIKVMQYNMQTLSRLKKDQHWFYLKIKEISLFWELLQI